MDFCIFIPISCRKDAFLCSDADLSNKLGNDGDYTPIMPSDNNGFYDWLRNYRRKIIGVRWFSFDNFSYGIVEKILENSSVNFKLDRCSKSFSLFFSDSDKYEESISCDQGFGGNNIYKYGDNFVMSFSLEGVDALSEFYGLNIST